MAEYIEREALLNALSESTEPFNVASVFRTIKRQSKADVAPVRHGRWIEYLKNLGECSECGEIVAIRSKYCPNCGCKMILEDKQ